MSFSRTCAFVKHFVLSCVATSFIMLGIPTMSFAAENRVGSSECTRAELSLGGCTKKEAYKIFRKKDGRLSMFIRIPSKDAIQQEKTTGTQSPMLWQFKYSGGEVYVKMPSGKLGKYVIDRSSLSKTGKPRKVFRYLTEGESHPRFRNLSTERIATFGSDNGTLCEGGTDVDCEEYPGDETDPDPSEEDPDDPPVDPGEDCGEGAPAQCSATPPSRAEKFLLCTTLAKARWTSGAQWCWDNTSGLEFVECSVENEMLYEMRMAECLSILVDPWA